MERFTTEQRTRTIEFYYLNQRSIILTQRAYRRHFNVRISPSESMIRCLVDRHHQHGSVTDLPRTGRPRLSRTAENIERVQQSVNEAPETSARRRSAQLGMSRTSLRRILKKDLQLYPHKVQLVQELKPADRVEASIQENPETSTRRRCTQLAMSRRSLQRILHTFDNNDCVDSQIFNMADKPKRPLSAYMLWLASAREQIKKENPGIKVTEVAKRGGEIWRAMKDKSEWEAKAAQAKEDYEEACRQYDANGGLPSGSGKKRSKPAKKGAKKSKKTDSDDEEEEESE